MNQVALTEDPAKRLAMADRARRMLADWPAHNYGYRAGDVAQLAALLDEVVSELRVAAGQSRFELNLVANVRRRRRGADAAAADAARERRAGVHAGARVAATRHSATSLLRGITEALAAPAREGGWAAALRARANIRAH